MDKATTARLKILLQDFNGSDTSEQNLIIGRKVIDIYAQEFKPEACKLVDSIEKDPFPSTQHSYGRYLAAVQTLGKGFSQLGWIQALQVAGAGAGLQSALQIIRG